MKVTPLKHCSAIIIVFALTQLGQPAFAANPGVDPQSVTASVKAGVHHSHQDRSHSADPAQTGHRLPGR